MAKQIFINLAVNNLKQSYDFYNALGFENNPQFSDDTAKCMVWNEHIFVMLLTHDKFKSFTNKSIADTKSHIAALYSLSFGSINEVNEIMQHAIKAGGIEVGELKDFDFMQVRTIEDFDGHTWELFYMDMTKFPEQNNN